MVHVPVLNLSICPIRGPSSPLCLRSRRPLLQLLLQLNQTQVRRLLEHNLEWLTEQHLFTDVQVCCPRLLANQRLAPRVDPC